MSRARKYAIDLMTVEGIHNGEPTEVSAELMLLTRAVRYANHDALPDPAGGKLTLRDLKGHYAYLGVKRLTPIVELTPEQKENKLYWSNNIIRRFLGIPDEW